MRRNFLISFSLIIIVGIVLVYKTNRKESMASEITTAFSSIKQIPDPANIVTTWEWYFLNHISSPLIQFNHEEGRFNPLIAQEWEISDNQVRFKIRDDAVFSDGSPITAKDLESSIKRLLIKKTATHFPVWEYFRGCENLKNLEDHCEGIKIINSKTIHFTLYKAVESFFLLMASPEGGIWATSDINSKSLEINPKKFSGPYIVEEITEKYIKLQKNQKSFIHQIFQNSPQSIISYTASGDELQTLLREKKVDVYIEPIRPFYSENYEDWGLKRNVSVFSTILYLSKIGNHDKHFGVNFFKQLWTDSNLNSELTSAETVLPFGSLGALDKKAFFEEIPEESSNKIKIAFLFPYFTDKLINAIVEAGKRSDVEISPVKVKFNEWLGILGSEKNLPQYDFVFAPYVASERYPSVQIKFMLEGRKPPFDLENLDLPNASIEKRKELERLQRWMIHSQNVLPLFFTRNHIIYKDGVDIGNQPISDSEIQLWRVQKGH